MTDWVDTDMKVYGTREDLDIFKNEVSENDNREEWRNSVFSFNKIIPMPEDVSEWEEDELYTAENYWEIEHWGARLGTGSASVKDKKNYLHYKFDNPCVPPVPIFNTLINRYPSLNFEIRSGDVSGTWLLVKSNKGKITIFDDSPFIDEENYEPSEPIDIKYVEVNKANSRSICSWNPTLLMFR